MDNGNKKIVEVSHLSKNYGEIRAVDDLNFYVNVGTHVSFLGPNGAGKSTTIDILCALSRPDAGEVIIDGTPLGLGDASIKSKIGVVFQKSLLDSSLTVKENLLLRARLYSKGTKQGTEMVASAAEKTNATTFWNRPYGKLSGGQRRRADIARALLGSPKLLILDEPTTGLDPQTRVSIWETVHDLQRNHGVTVFLTTHYLQEAANSDYVFVIDNGKLAARGTPTEFKAQYTTDTVCILPVNLADFIAGLESQNHPFIVEGGKVIITLGATRDAIPLLHQYETQIKHFEVRQGTMDDAFINVTGGAIRE